ncbi:MAG TPA: YXWGXW repeat-containing protein [Casimicrobiaceae bacterium]|nr:YXWGXW repeat-containing protein [Casimicrobiaceae bacterium]
MKATRMRAAFARLVVVLIAVVALVSPNATRAQVYLSVNLAPPELPVYEQPPIPAPGYIWTPGYWAWAPVGYYWVPGTWVLAPYVGALWTPGYWGWSNGLYWWHPGYWGPHVGFYGGINYGYGYTGVGYYGGRWDRGVFYYNRSVSNVHITNVHVYNETIVERPVTRASFNGPNGVVAHATAEERIAERDRHTGLVAAQANHERAASANRAMFASVNGGRPTMAATMRPQSFAGNQASIRSFSQQAVANPNLRMQGQTQSQADFHARTQSQAQMKMAPQGHGQMHSQAQMYQQGQMHQQMQVQGGQHPQGQPQQHGGQNGHNGKEERPR